MFFVKMKGPFPSAALNGFVRVFMIRYVYFIAR
jgi:hypothetical protein